MKDRNGEPFGTWHERFVDWFRDLGFLQKPGVETKAAKDVAAYAEQRRGARIMTGDLPRSRSRSCSVLVAARPVGHAQQAPPRAELRRRRQANPRRGLHSLPQREEGQRRPELHAVHEPGDARIQARHLGDDRRQGQERRHAAGRRGSALGARAGGDGVVSRVGVRARRSRSEARPGPRAGAPADARRVRQHRPRPARRRFPRDRRVPARRFRLRLRQHRRRA